MASFLKAQDTINGKKGEVFITTQGERREFVHLKQLRARIDVNKAPINTLGAPGTQQKIIGTSGTGSLTYFWGDRIVRNEVLTYLKALNLGTFVFDVINDDKGSAVGRSHIRLTGCTFDGSDIAAIDVDATTALEASTNFSFEFAVLVEDFNEIEGGI
jgi:hypothetical protein